MWMRFIRFNWLFYRSDHWSLSFYLFIQIKINGLAEGSEFLFLHSIFVLCGVLKKNKHLKQEYHNKAKKVI